MPFVNLLLEDERTYRQAPTFALVFRITVAIYFVADKSELLFLLVQIQLIVDTLIFVKVLFLLTDRTQNVATRAPKRNKITPLLSTKYETSSWSSCTRSTGNEPLSRSRRTISNRLICHFRRSLRCSSCSRRLFDDPDFFFFAPPCSVSISASACSTCRWSSSTLLDTHCVTLSFSCALGSSFEAAMRPSLEKALVFISFSHALKRSIC